MTPVTRTRPCTTTTAAATRRRSVALRAAHGAVATYLLDISAQAHPRPAPVRPHPRPALPARRDDGVLVVNS